MTDPSTSPSARFACPLDCGARMEPESLEPALPVPRQPGMPLFLRGLTWKRFGIFCAVVIISAFASKGSLSALRNGHDTADTLRRLGITYVLAFVQFAPVLLAVVIAENFPSSSQRLRGVRFVVGVVAGQMLGVILYAQGLRLFYPEMESIWSGHWMDPLHSVRHYVGMVFLQLCTSSAAAAFYYCLARDGESTLALQRGRLEREQVERENAEAKLAVMQAQIEPHFIFNTLASVRRLYQTDPASGRRMLEHLSRYLTASLPRMREVRSTLGRELALATAYLSVQKIRMASRLDFRVDVPPALHPCVIPPMMLATLVENAVIHGLGPLPGGGSIVIRARSVEGRLEIDVADTGRGLQETWGVGVGLANICARLQSEYGDAASLELAGNEGSGVVATLQLPLVVPAEALAA
jgi:sensor histidine kinase YesM